MNNESCIQTIELLRNLALNIHGVIDVVDDRNCNDIIALLKEQEPVKPKSKVRHGENAQYQHFCGNCMAMLFGKPKFCSNCGREVAWE